jgi:hypothetical protein
VVVFVSKILLSKVFLYGFDLKTLNYIKRRRVDEEEDSENEQKYHSQVRIKQKMKRLIKKSAFTTVAW